MSKERLDILLVEKGLFESRERARAAIMSGNINVDGMREDKPGSKFSVDSNIEVKENPCPFVSRGGFKLSKALVEFNISLNGLKAADVGASTGGFTDCMLKNDAVKIYAIDVGYGQLAWKLRNDPRVVCMERFNVRYIKPDDISELLDFASIDVSFISLSKVLPAVNGILKDDGSIVCLIKPQFEAGREKVGKHGVVRDPSVHVDVIDSVIKTACSLGLNSIGLTYSPITGPEGNIEYLLYCKKDQHNLPNEFLRNDIAKTVDMAHKSLGSNKCK